jgi:asparagine synthase (glutamine-hydrolysing)
VCGIAGILNLSDGHHPDGKTLQQMLGMIRHRGPDESGIYRDGTIAMGSVRLGIVDLEGGCQPIGNEDGHFWIVFNGEIFNYAELRSHLETRGHRFSTRTDTEVILHLYEDLGPECLKCLNGQFAIAVWDAERHQLFLARDRLGVRPLFYTVHAGCLIFGSEIKSILAYPKIRAEIDPTSLRQIFTFWSTLAPRTVFRDIYEIPPAHYLIAQADSIDIRRYWSLDFTAEPVGHRSSGEYEEEFESLLVDATQIRLRADVPVGAYLSGGLDSSLTTAIVHKHSNNHLETFSVAFENPDFDESKFQLQMAGFLGTKHRVVVCTDSDIGHAFPDIIWHTETPILRTAPAPLFMLSKLVHDHGLKVVLTGEGADEFLGGYDIFKEMKIRRFWAKNPDSRHRPLLLQRLYPDIAALGNTSAAFLFAFFRRGFTDIRAPYYSHAIRWSNTAHTLRFLLDDEETSIPYAESIPLPPDFAAWPHLGQAQYLEASIFLPEYLLSSQGDRMAMAHSVEGRYPFLDYRVVEFANHLPPDQKLRGLTEKWILKRLGRRLLPPEIWQRPKRPYRAPVHRSFFPDTPDYVDELLSQRALHENGIFKAASVSQLVHKARTSARLSEVEEMALAGVLSTQLVYHHFVKNFTLRPPLADNQSKVVDMARRMEK